MDCPKCEMPDSLKFVDSFYQLEECYEEFNIFKKKDLIKVEIWICEICESLFYKTIQSNFIEKLEMG